MTIKRMAHKNKLTAHADRRHRLLREGATAYAIWENLQGQEVAVSYEGVRKWIHSHPIDGITLNPPGRPRSVDSGFFQFLPSRILSPKHPQQSPAFLLPFVALRAETEGIGTEVTKRAFWQIGLPFDETCPRSDWTIPSKLVANLTDLEYLLLAYLVSDLKSHATQWNHPGFRRMV
jgi:hypothetical protein